MYDFIILMPTFNRSSFVEAIVKQLKQEAKECGYTILHCLADDGSDFRFHPYKELAKKWSEPYYRIQHERNFKNFGRKGFWKTWNVLFGMAQKEEWQYAIALPDDCVLCIDFLGRVSAHFEAIYKNRDGRAVAMNLRVSAKRNWLKNRWVDGAFVARREFFQVLDWKMKPVAGTWFDGTSRNRNPASSGVGKQMSDRMAASQQYRIARVRNVSFIKTTGADSVMFPRDQFPRRKTSWGLHNFIDDADKKDSDLKKKESQKVPPPMEDVGESPKLAPGRAFGIIGEGRISERHKKAIGRIGGEIRAIYDPAKSSQAETNGLYHRGLDADFFGEVDWVVVTSPTHLHYQHVKMSLARGKKVICEKPYVLPWQPVIDSENVFVVLQLRWAGLPKRAKEVRLIASRNDAYFTGWKGKPLLTGGLFFDLFIHYIDLARMYGGTFHGRVNPNGPQERWVDQYDLMKIDMDAAYARMYQDIVFEGKGIRPAHVAELHWLLGKYTGRFGAGKEILEKDIVVTPDELV
jgi:hypothetical protein